MARPVQRMLITAGAALQRWETVAIRPSALIVENASLSVLALALALEEAGVEVVGMLRLGEEAVAKVAELRPDVVVMDVRLRRRMDGIEAARIIRRRWQGPILFHTAETDVAAREAMAALGGLAPRLAVPRQVAAIVGSLATAGSSELAGQPLGDADIL